MSDEELRASVPEESEATASAVGAADPKEELARKDKQINDLEGQLKRLAADFENFRRRQAQERENLVAFAAQRVFDNLLPVVDNFDRALQSSRGATEVTQVLQGVELIHRLLADFLAKSGVSAMESVGSIFDPNLHEAIAQVGRNDVPDQTVLAEIQKGYYLNGKVLRHAMVQVAVNPDAPPATSQPTMNQEAATPSETAENKEEHHG